MGGGQLLTLDHIKSLQRTNPELVVIRLPGSQSTTPGFIGDRAPFNDINVRIALQKAINLEEINRTFYGGDSDPIPYGFVTPLAKGQSAPYAEWPEEVKWQYQYDLEEAERLLDEAGYPRGADDIRFEVVWDVIPIWGDDEDLVQLVKSYWDKIGVVANLKWPYHAVSVPSGLILLQQPAGHAQTRVELLLRAGMKPVSNIVSACCRQAGHAPIPWFGDMHSGDPAMFTRITYPEFTAIYEEVLATTDLEEFKKLVTEMDRHYIKEMWSLALPTPSNYVLHQPWFKGYRGELGNGSRYNNILDFVWVDQEMKTKMGH